MALNDLNRELYSSNKNEIADRTHEQSNYGPEIATRSGGANPFITDEKWNEPQKGLSAGQKKGLWIGIGIFFFVALSIAGLFFYQWWTKNAFHQDRVSISFEGPKEADSTKPSKYIIHYANNNRVTLKNAEIQLSYPENFQPTDNLNLRYLSPSAGKIFIGDIKPMSSGEVELVGIFYAPKDFPAYVRGEIHFVPSNGTQELFMDAQIGVSIIASPVVLVVAAPQQVTSGDRLEYVVEYKNLDTRSISNVQVRIDFPQGFEMSDSQPKSSEKNAYWYVGTLEPGQSGKINIQGNISGNTNEGKNITVSLGHTSQSDQFVLYDKQQLTTRIVTSALTIVQQLTDKEGTIVNSGEVLKYAITFQNTSNTGLRDAIITVKINSKVLDFGQLKVEKGSFDGSKNLITWKASDVPELANVNPGAGGVVKFTIPVKSIIPVESALDKNFIISSVARIDSPDISTLIDSNKIIGSNNLDLKLASKVLLSTKGFYNDSNIKNTGPIPMQVNKETTFTLHWQLATVSNDITSARIVSSLPSGVRWTGKFFPADEKITYNSRTNEIIWDAGEIKAGSGVLGQPREISFQVAVTPQANQVGSVINLLNLATFNGKDLFVNKDVNLENPVKDTSLPEDPAVGYINSKVAK